MKPEAYECRKVRFETYRAALAFHQKLLKETGISYPVYPIKEGTYPEKGGKGDLWIDLKGENDD